MATALKFENFGDYTKKGSAITTAADGNAFRVNLLKLYNLLEDSYAEVRGAGTGYGSAGTPGPGPKPEFDRIDPVSRRVLRREIQALYDASINADIGTGTDLNTPLA